MVLDEVISVKLQTDKKLDFLVKLKSKIGDQKIDLIISKDTARPIEQIALKEGMIINKEYLKTAKYIKECETHIVRIKKANDDIKDILPLSSQAYLDLDDEEIKTIDQYIFRFSKLQDTIGNKLFKIVVAKLVQDIDDMSFKDILNKLEQTKILDSTQQWERLREIRNSISHNYDDEPDEMAQDINNIFAQKSIVINIFNNIKSALEV